MTKTSVKTPPRWPREYEDVMEWERFYFRDTWSLMEANQPVIDGFLSQMVSNAEL